MYLPRESHFGSSCLLSNVRCARFAPFLLALCASSLVVPAPLRSPWHVSPRTPSVSSCLASSLLGVHPLLPARILRESLAAWLSCGTSPADTGGLERLAERVRGAASWLREGGAETASCSRFRTLRFGYGQVYFLFLFISVRCLSPVVRSTLDTRPRALFYGTGSEFRCWFFVRSILVLAFTGGYIITVRSKRFRCAEVLPQPGFIGTGVSGFHDTSR